MKVTYHKLDGLLPLPVQGDALKNFMGDAVSAHMHPCRKCERWFLCKKNPCPGGSILDVFSDKRIGLGPVIICQDCR